MAAKRFEVTDAPIAVEEVQSRVADPENGAILLFVGVVRNNSEGRTVRYLEYEAYAEMAEQVMQQIAEEIRARWTSVRDTVMVHRTGRLEIGDVSVVIALSAAHRPEMFEAMRYAVDRLKEVVPIWKREVWEDGAVWKSEAGPNLPSKEAHHG